MDSHILAIEPATQGESRYDGELAPLFLHQPTPSVSVDICKEAVSCEANGVLNNWSVTGEKGK